MLSEMSNAEKAKVLIDIRAVIKEPKSWTKSVFALDPEGYPCSATSRYASKFCLLGAIRNARDMRGEYLLAEITAPKLRQRREQPYEKVAAWNDDPNRRHIDVLNLLDDSIYKFDPTYVRPKLSLMQWFRSWKHKG